MATDTLYFSGKAKWAQNLFVPDQKYNNYKVNLHLDEESLAKFVSSGLALTIKEDPEMGPFVVFRRPVSKMIMGKTVSFSPPSVVDKEGEKHEGNIGNGSDISCKVVMYDTVKGKGHRLEAVRVDNLVVYESENSDGFPDEMVASAF
tara:strand:+ start:6396 stop:6836 length:441 start_codon:yes stop_codon:yes gene_type:complete